MSRAANCCGRMWKRRANSVSRSRRGLARGDFVPDEVVLAVVCEAVTAACADGNGYILDGFPRTRAQAEHAYELAVPKGIAAEVAVYLALPDEVARERLAGRAEGGRLDDADARGHRAPPAVVPRQHAPDPRLLRRRDILVPVDARPARRRGIGRDHRRPDAVILFSTIAARRRRGRSGCAASCSSCCARCSRRTGRRSSSRRPHRAARGSVRT